MKKTILLLLFTLISALSYGQKALFDRYDDADKVTTVYISRSMMQLMGDVKDSFTPRLLTDLVV